MNSPVTSVIPNMPRLQVIIITARADCWFVPRIIGHISRDRLGPARDANFGSLITTQTSSRRTNFPRYSRRWYPARRFVVVVFPGYSCITHENWRRPDKLNAKRTWRGVSARQQSVIENPPPRPARAGPHNFALRQTGIVLLPQTTVWSRAGVHEVRANCLRKREKQPYAGHRRYIQSGPRTLVNYTAFPASRGFLNKFGVDVWWRSLIVILPCGFVIQNCGCIRSRGFMT